MVTLVILDGFGEKKGTFGNAINSQGTPHLDKLKKMYPHTLIEASGEAVGLPKGVMKQRSWTFDIGKWKSYIARLNADKQ